MNHMAESAKKQYFTRMGDGFGVYMTGEEIMADIRAGVEDAAAKGKIDPLTEDEIRHIYDIVTMPGNIVGVERGKEVVTTTDAGCHKFETKCGVPVERSVQAMVHERILGGDSVDLGNTDFNFKTSKGVANREAGLLKSALDKTTFPVLFGAMPNLGFYTKPNGPVDNWATLLPEGKIKEALKAQEEAIELAVNDILYLAEMMNEVGADGINMDTSGAAGDADWLAALKAAEIISEKYPHMGVEMGMAGEFVLGMHGRLTYYGQRLAGLFPHQQVKIAEKAGVSIFGPVVNTNCSKSFPWNIARVCTFIKACSEVSQIPIHPNAGMGVCGIPMCDNVPTDVVSRADKCMVEICKIDGL
jgi:dimethylamine--corrinoid protein Co-methyltransferase